MNKEYLKKGNIIPLIFSSIGTIGVILYSMTKLFKFNDIIFNAISIIIMLSMLLLTSIQFYEYNYFKKNPYIIIGNSFFIIYYGLIPKKFNIQISDIKNIEIDSSPVILLKTIDIKDYRIDLGSLREEDETSLRDYFQSLI